MQSHLAYLFRDESTRHGGSHLTQDPNPVIAYLLDKDHVPAAYVPAAARELISRLNGFPKPRQNHTDGCVQAITTRAHLCDALHVDLKLHGTTTSMDSSELYQVKQQFVLGAYKSLVDLTLPDPNSPDYTPTTIYQARAHIALENPKAALAVIPHGSENVAVRAVAALARYTGATKDAEKDAALEELRDLAVEIEGEDVEGDEKDKWLVRTLAGTAFARAGEVEEALETLGAGSNTQSLEAIAVTVQVYLSIHRPDLAKKELERAKRWAEDDLLLQHIEATINLVTGADSYSDCNSFYTEQLANPSLSSPHLLTARGVTRLLRGEVSAARSDLEEAISQQGGNADAETLAAMTVAAGLGQTKHHEVDAEQLWSQLSSKYPTFPLVQDVKEKAALFDELVTKFEIPALAVAAA
ncbi:hypothetical protein NM688_g2734 [Phlebia brevispora]|uniref:Uncharacterized protein n=1 Tax=Phlebia brevispora TaxID=194682 RepID=A0ACC1T7N9_9APHY|nr:hypothetical protein NM688_g2734 [Phlebia brevispora]